MDMIKVNKDKNILQSMTTGQTPSAAEDDLRWSKAPKQLLNELHGAKIQEWTLNLSMNNMLLSSASTILAHRSFS